MTVRVPRSNSRSASPARRVTPGDLRAYREWGTPMPSFSEDKLDRCRHEFRGHYSERHGLDPP
jgi:hypothetical protein